MTLPNAAFRVLTTERLVLRKLQASDANEIFTLRSDARILKYLLIPRANSVEDAAAFIQKIVQMGNESCYWGISLKTQPELIGTICLWNFEPENYRAETGYVLHPDHQGKGIMSEALQAVLEYGFTELKLHTITACLSPENTASAQLLERNDFKREALFRENVFHKGTFIDSLIYTCLATDFKK